MFDKYIKVNLPLTEAEYISGNGEGVWVEVVPETKAAYDRDEKGGQYFGILANDSIYYPGMNCGTVLPFEMRGEMRPVADFPNFLSRLPKLTPEAKAAVIRKISENAAEVSE